MQVLRGGRARKDRRPLKRRRTQRTVRQEDTSSRRRAEVEPEREDGGLEPLARWRAEVEERDEEGNVGV